MMMVVVVVVVVVMAISFPRVFARGRGERERRAKGRTGRRKGATGGTMTRAHSRCARAAGRENGCCVCVCARGGWGGRPPSARAPGRTGRAGPGRACLMPTGGGVR